MKEKKTVLNEKSRFYRMITEICAEEGISLESAAYGWAFRMRKGERSGFLYGYRFGLNSAAAADICNSKSTASELLLGSGIPAVPHFGFLPPATARFAGQDGSLTELEELRRRYGILILKNDTGTGGTEVFPVVTEEELSQAAEKLFSAGKTIAASPYVSIAREIRVVILDGEAKLMFSKQRESVTGDGHSTLEELIFEQVVKNQTDPKTEKEKYADTKEKKLPAGPFTDAEFHEWELTEIPQEGTVVYLNWKHNLGQGAVPEVLEREKDPGEWDALEALAVRAAKALGIRFASVDVIEEEAAGDKKVLEVNCGVMLEHFSGCSGEYYQRAKEIYREAVKKSLENSFVISEG